MRAKRSEFTDAQKADICVRERALCSYSGLSLWLLDYGASDIFNIDSVYHIRPAAEGGKAKLVNGVCASGLYNSAKGTGTNVRLYDAGRPTSDFLFFHGTIPIEVARHLKRFAALHHSDWYFNRAVFQTLLSAARRFDQFGNDGTRVSRGPAFHGKSALKFLIKWRRLLEAERPATMKVRGLLPARPSPDQKLLPRLLRATTIRDVSRISKALAPYLKASEDPVYGLSEVTTPAEAKALLVKVKRDRFVTPSIRRTVELNLRRLGLLSKTGARVQVEPKPPLARKLRG